MLLPVVRQSGHASIRGQVSLRDRRIPSYDFSVTDTVFVLSQSCRIDENVLLTSRNILASTLACIVLCGISESPVPHAGYGLAVFPRGFIQSMSR